MCPARGVPMSTVPSTTSPPLGLARTGTLAASTHTASPMGAKCRRADARKRFWEAVD